ncbi:MAG: ribosomal RNA small subunit methyltransferase A, partial [Planctomyces sp.]|nr:ribosomal RNA small subunit methyltransferase A [Planctomyces sp.]
KLRLNPRGDLGQNFLIDINLVELVAREAQLSRSDVVLEVGTGTGGLTIFLAAEAGEVVSIEYDPNMHAIAVEQHAELTNVQWVNTDALKSKNQLHPLLVEAVDRALAKVPGSTLKLVANLPYNVATPVISMVVGSGWPWSRMVVTVQWEMAVRMQAKPGSGDYSGLSIWLQSQCEVETLRKLPPDVFWPRPKIDSAVVLVTPAPAKRDKIANPDFFHDYLRAIFIHRRKLLRGVLCSAYPQVPKPRIDALLAEAGITPQARGEELSPEIHVEMANLLHHDIPRSHLNPQ